MLTKGNKVIAILDIENISPHACFSWISYTYTCGMVQTACAVCSCVVLETKAKFAQHIIFLTSSLQQLSSQLCWTLDMQDTTTITKQT